MNRIVVFVIVCINSLAVISHATDYSEHWAKDNIIRGINNGNISGYIDGRFLPNNYVRINEFLKMLIKCNENQMCDGQNHWAETYINYAYENKLMLDKSIDFSKEITRKEAFIILFNYIKQYYIEAEVKVYQSDFIDYKNDVSEINYLLKNEIIKGFENKTLKLNDKITRGEAISIIYRVNDYINNKIYSEKFSEKIFENPSINSYMNYKDNKVFLNDFKFENGIYIYRDRGRLDNYENIYTDSKTSKYISNIILGLVNKNNYIVNTLYRYDNSIHIFYGEKSGYMSNGSYIFEVVIYLKENEYHIKIEVYKLWKEMNEIKNNIRVNKYYENKLKSVLMIFFSEAECNEIITNIKLEKVNVSNKYILEKNGFRYSIYLKS